MNYSGAEGLEFGGGNTTVDPAVAATKGLPKGSRVTSTEPHGISFWSNTGRIDVELEETGSSQSFFIKVISGELGRNMMHGEYESMRAIHALVPNFVPEPVAWGTYTSVPDTHFFLCEYREMMDEMPADPHQFTAALAALHQNSRPPPETEGKFGFHITTYSGNLPQVVEWEASWEIFFAKSMKLALELELKAKGPHPDFDVLVPILFEKVIPRLLRPLESEGRSVKPSLIHGDLWFANSGVDVDMTSSLIFDACCFYAHNEYEFGQWRPVCNRFGAEYLAAYHSYVRISPPEEDYDGRLDLYKL
ncbi:MAG: hypothetical protein LQ342_003412 [Letrouitia transgressa]|nr:MAG: hypothetical protein LQ342_003412 [Letrouitia transgressa]